MGVSALVDSYRLCRLLSQTGILLQNIMTTLRKKRKFISSLEMEWRTTTKYCEGAVQLGKQEKKLHLVIQMLATDFERTYTKLLRLSAQEIDVAIHKNGLYCS